VHRKKIRSGKLLDWTSIPFYVPKRVIKALQKAVTNRGKRYANVSEFLTQLAKARAGLPDWIANEDGFQLQNWKGNDYLLQDSGNQIILKKRNHKAKVFRVDNSVKAQNFDIAYTQLKTKIGLP
jgi:hypothetical protein